MGNSTVTYTLGMEPGRKPEPAPRGLICTRAVETRGGWIGQVIIDTEIVYETPPITGEEDAGEMAQQEANSYVIERVKALFNSGGAGAPAATA